MHGNAHTWTAAEDAILGTLPDADVAKKLKLARKTIVARRAALGIPPHRRGEASITFRATNALRVLIAAIESAGPRVPASVRNAAKAAGAAIGVK